MAEWLSNIVVTIIILVAIGIFYKMLKEPIHLIIYWLKSIIGYGKERMSDNDNINYTEIIYR